MTDPSGVGGGGWRFDELRSAFGNQRSEWDAGCRFDFDNPEHR